MQNHSFKKLIVFGCSFTKDNYQSTWADLLADNLNLPLINYAERGAGADFVVKRLLCSNNINDDDLTIILWPSADRYDLWTDQTTPHLLKDVDTAGWLDGKGPTLVDYNGTYNKDSGFILNGSIPRGYKHNYYKYFYSADQSVNNWLTNIVTAQLYLDSKKIPYLMASSFPLQNPIHYHHDSFCINKNIYNHINLTKFVDHSETQGFFQFCEHTKLPFHDSTHPATESHRIWVEQLLLPKILALQCNNCV